jgi:large subunit ribosomal protein L6
MSRIGRKPIDVPKGITVSVEGDQVIAKGAKEQLAVRIPAPLTARVVENRVEVAAPENDVQAGMLHGTTRTLIANMIGGLQKPYTKDLEIQGVGFRAQLQGQKLVLSLGFSHPIEYPVPAGITVNVKDGTALTVSGADKHLVGLVSSRIKSYFPAEPYKGKGVRFKGEHIRRKAGKAVA